MAVAPATDAASKSGRSAGRRGFSIRGSTSPTIPRPASSGDTRAQARRNWALTILADFLGDDVRAVALHQEFKCDQINPIADDEFCISGDVLERWCRRHGERLADPEERDQPPDAATGAARRLHPSCTS